MDEDKKTSEVENIKRGLINNRYENLSQNWEEGYVSGLWDGA